MNSIDWKEFFERLDKINFSNFDLIVAIGNGGIIPAAFIQRKLNIPMKIIGINYRDEENKPKYDDAKIIEAEINFKNKKVLLIDDVSRTGKTLAKAKEILKGNMIKTFVINGEADYNLFNSKECIMMPWNKN
jgi:uncharacterized protein